MYLCILTPAFRLLGFFVSMGKIQVKETVMHEASLITGMMDLLRESARQNNINKINKVKLVVGKFTMALPDSLQFAFKALGQEELFKDAELEIEEQDIVCQCNSCGHQFPVRNGYVFMCPVCSGNQVDIISGRDLFVEYYEGDSA